MGILPVVAQLGVFAIQEKMRRDLAHVSAQGRVGEGQRVMDAERIETAKELRSERKAMPGSGRSWALMRLRSAVHCQGANLEFVI